jgi:L-lactate dehydrogenase complex protein LldG
VRVSGSRAAILAAVRQALGRGAPDGDLRARLDERIATPPRHPRPAIEEDLVARFVSKLEGRAATVETVGTRSDVPSAVERFRSAHGLPARAAMGAALRDLICPSDWSVHFGRADIADSLAVSAAFLGIAETGTLMLLSSPESPTTHNFVPESQVVILERDHLVRHFEEAWSALRQRGVGMPRAVNLISGPSRTADIEQTIQLGAHGPRRLHLILVSSSKFAAHRGRPNRYDG